MKSMQDAVAISKKEQDNFYVTAFLIEAWLGQVVLDATAEYAEKKNAKDRRMQAAQSRRGFLKVFGHAKDEEFSHVFGALCRSASMQDVCLKSSCKLLRHCPWSMIAPLIL
jgi:hypothetical protein